MNDSLRTDVFVRYMPETIAVACIYLAARKLKEPLPKNPSWFEVLGVEEDDIKDCCYRMIQLYNRKKVSFLDQWSVEGVQVPVQFFFRILMSFVVLSIVPATYFFTTSY